MASSIRLETTTTGDLDTNSFTTATTSSSEATTTPRPSLTGQYADQCGLRHSSYRADQRARGGRIIWTDEESAGATSAPEGTFPWLASLFLRRESGEAYFMCAATILTPNE